MMLKMKNQELLKELAEFDLLADPTFYLLEQ